MFYDLYVHILPDGCERAQYPLAYPGGDQTTCWAAMSDGVRLRTCGWRSRRGAAPRWVQAGLRVDVADLVKHARRIFYVNNLTSCQIVFDDARDDESIRPRTHRERWALGAHARQARDRGVFTVLMEIEYSRAVELTALSPLMHTMPVHMRG